MEEKKMGLSEDVGRNRRKQKSTFERRRCSLFWHKKMQDQNFLENGPVFVRVAGILAKSTPTPSCISA